MKIWISRRKWILPLLLVGLALAARWIPGPRTIDDSYITFRYARNLLAGQGFVYNPGERVQGTTTPLYTLLMAGLGALAGGTRAPFPWLALLVNSAADAGTCLLLVRLGRRAGAEWAGAAAGVLWALAPFSVTFAIGGLETSLYVLLLTGMVAAYLDYRRALTGLLAVLALLTRPDALILVVPLGLDRLYRAWRARRVHRSSFLEDQRSSSLGAPSEQITRREVLAFFLPGLAWALFATLYFGSPIPHSVQAKLQVYHLGANESLVRLLQHYATPFFAQNWFGALAIGVGLFLHPFLYLVGALRAYRSQPRLLAWLAYPWLYLLAFALPNPLIFRWYLTPPLPAYFLIILVGLESVLVGLQNRFFRKSPTEGAAPLPSWHRWAIGGLVLLLPLAPTLSEWRLVLDHGPQSPAPDMAFIKLEELYHRAAMEIAPQMSATSLLAAGDVGVLGYYTPGRILDTVGLNSPVSLKYYPLAPQAYVINYAIPADLILDQEPDWVVILEVYGRKTLLVDPRFAQAYRLVDTLDTDMYGSKGMLIFRRNESGE